MKIKRMIKKILRTIFIWWSIVLLLALPTFAFLETAYDPTHYFVGSWQARGTQWQWYMKTYYQNHSGTMNDDITFNGASEVYGVFMSKIQPDTFYSFTTEVEFTGTEPELESGDLIPTAYQWFNVIPASTFPEITASTGELQQQTTEPIPLLNSDFYKIYYDKNLTQLSVVFYIPSSYMEEHPELLEHCYLVLSLGQSMIVDGTPTGVVYGKTYVLENGLYTQKLNQIIVELQRMQQQSGGGITQEEVRQAVNQALQDHQNYEIEQGQGVLEQAGQYISSEFAPYFAAADSIRISLSGITDALTYEGTDGILVLPEGRNPFANNALLWPRQEIDLVSAWNSLPQTLRSVVTIVITMGVLTSVATEVLSVLEMWNTERDLFGK